MSKFKKLLMLVLVLSLKSTFFAQYFAPVGAKWYFNSDTFLAGIGYILYEAEKDTLLNGQNCTKIKGTYFGDFGDTSFLENEFVKYENNRVYYFKYNQFKLLYDFNLQVGDTLNFYDPQYSSWNPDTISSLPVDSIQYVEQDGHIYKTYFLGYDPQGYTFRGPVIEIIGGFNWPFPRQIVSFDDPGQLRCYIDSNVYVNMSQSNELPCDYYQPFDLSVSFTEKNQTHKIEVFPNPSNGIFSINLNKEIINPNCEFFDALGNKVLEIVLKKENNKIDVSFLSSGIYNLKIFDEDNLIENRKIVIETR